VRYLGLNLRPCAEIEFERFDCVAMVDAQPGTGNTSLPPGMVPDVVIDHHPMRPATRAVQFIDIRSKYGSTSTILLEYLVQAWIETDIQLATALFYGIRSDTQDLGRQATRQDTEAIAYLFPIANKRMLSEIQRGEVPQAYFQMLDEALRNARKYEHAIITDLGQIDNPDMIAEVADLLLREEETYWTLCHGISGGKLFISVRTMKEEARADKIIRRVVARKGTGGGHPAYAGGQIPLKRGTKAECEALIRLVQRRFLKAIGADTKHWQKLIPN
jgi:nanoRNase/pAp phosphatase (c-di-AMP/oligoRNAs hydrolase)